MSGKTNFCGKFFIIFNKLTGWRTKFKLLSLEKKLVVIVFLLCILLPFGMVRNPGEIATYVLPLWGCYYGYVGVWAYSGIPMWRAFLACYGIASFGIISLYFGIAGIMYFVSKFKWLSKIKSKIFKNKASDSKVKKETRKEKFTKWMSRQSIWVILFALFLPLPYSDPAATIAMKLKNVKYGLWYLLAVNILHVYLIVWCVYSGVNLIIIK